MTNATQTETKHTPEPQVTRHSLLSMQVCVPAEFTDEQARDFAERECPCGTSNGWFIRKEGDKDLAGSPERVACSDRAGCVHIMLDA